MAQQRDSAVQLKNEKILEVWAIVLNLKTHKSDMLCTSAEICSSDYKSAERTKKCLKLWRVSWHMCHSLLGSCNFFAWPQRIKCCLFSSFLNFLWYSVWVPKWVAAWSGSGFCWGCKEPFVCTYASNRQGKQVLKRCSWEVDQTWAVPLFYPNTNTQYFQRGLNNTQYQYQFLLPSALSGGS